MNDQLDPQAMALTKAIRQVESGGNFKARSKDGSFGAYQFLKSTWDNTARKYGVNAEWEKATPQQQNEVAYKQIKEWKDKGHNVGEIASMWNAGAGRPQAYLQGLKGTNSSGVNYNVANYAKKVATLYQGYKGQVQPQVQQEPIEPMDSVEPVEPTIPEQKQIIQSQGLPTSARRDRTQPTLVGGIIRDIVKQPIKAALSVARPFVDPLGKKGGLSVNTKYLGNVGDYGTEIEKSTNNLANKYKAGEISLGRAAIGGAGAGALQAMDFAAVAPVGKVASQAVKGTVKQALVPTLKTAAKESLIRGGAVGAGYDVSSQLASGEKYNPLQTVAAGAVGTVADLGLSYGLPKAISGTKSFAKNNLTKTGRDAKLTRKVEEELFNIENNYAKLRKNQKYSKDANTATRKRIVTTGVLDDAVDTTGVINTDNAIKKYRDASGLTGKEGVVRQNLERLGEKLNIKDAEKQLTDAIRNSNLEGSELRNAINNVKKEVSGYRLRADADGNLPLTFFHDAKIGTTNSIDFNTPKDIKAYKKTLASGLKDIVENNSLFNVREVNQELSPLFKDIEYLESLNGRKVKGGKLSKYTSQVTGNIVGGVAGGAIGGFPGSAIGTVVGGEVGSTLRGSSLSKVLRGPGSKELPVSKVLQKAAATAKSPRLGLPEPKAGLPKSQNFVPIELPGVKEPVYRSPRIAGNTTQYTNIPNTKPKNIDIPTELPKSKVKSSDLSTDLVSEAKKYKSAEEFVKAQRKPLNVMAEVDKNPEIARLKKKYTEDGVTLYRGEGGGGGLRAREDIGNALGDGEYYANLSQASRYGKNIKEKVVKLENPLIIQTDQDLRNITGGSNLVVGKNVTPQVVKQQISEARKRILDAGYDGVIIKMKSYQDSQNLIRLFEHDQTIVYPKSQLTDIWNKANKTGLPKAIKLIRNKDGSVTYGKQKMSGDLSTDLVSEAKKYKSAEEFVKELKKEVSEKFGIENPSQKTVEDWFIAKQKGIIGGPQKELVEATLNGENTGWKTFNNASKDLIDSHFGDNSTEIVTVYRGVNPKETKFVKRKLYNGDFVTGKKQYAQQYGNVSEYKINKKDLIYAPDGKEILVANGLNPIQKPIPLSQLTDIWNKANK